MNPPLPSGVREDGAVQRLEQSRAAIARWLEQNVPAPATPSAVGCAVRGILPLLEGWREHRGTAVVLAALARAWLRPGPSRPEHQPVAQPRPGDPPGTHRHTRTALLMAGIAGLALTWWSRAPRRRPPS